MQIDPGEIEFCKHEDGSLWELGSGGYGHVSARRTPRVIIIMQSVVL